jgi:hypothetical protein
LTIVTSGEEIDRLRVPSEILSLVSDWFGLLSILGLLIDDVLARGNDDLRLIRGIVVNEEYLRVSGNGNPMLNRGDLKIVNGLIDFPFLNWSFKIRVFPEFDFSVFSSSNKVLTILVNI